MQVCRGCLRKNISFCECPWYKALKVILDHKHEKKIKKFPGRVSLGIYPLDPSGNPPPFFGGPKWCGFHKKKSTFLCKVSAFYGNLSILYIARDIHARRRPGMAEFALFLLYSPYKKMGSKWPKILIFNPNWSLKMFLMLYHGNSCAKLCATTLNRPYF